MLIVCFYRFFDGGCAKRHASQTAYKRVRSTPPPVPTTTRAHQPLKSETLNPKP